MPEDQGVNGDSWNQEAAKLLTKFGWLKVGDSNVDVKNEDGKLHGLDGMFVFEDAKRNTKIPQGVIVEAKRYKTTSLKSTDLQTWITTLNTKITKIKNSNNFQKDFPKIGKAIIQNGLIILWFSDLENYSSFIKDFGKSLLTIKPFKSNTATPNHIYILYNEHILRLCSLLDTIEKINLSNKKNPLKFYYPSSDYFNYAVSRSYTLTIDYIFSKFILAESIIRNTENKFVFYFGELTIQAFIRLRSFLLLYSFIEKKKPLTMYIYSRDDEFRKIKPDVMNLFKKIDIKVKIEGMNLFSDLPTFLKDE